MKNLTAVSLGFAITTDLLELNGVTFKAQVAYSITHFGLTKEERVDPKYDLEPEVISIGEVEWNGREISNPLRQIQMDAHFEEQGINIHKQLENKVKSWVKENINTNEMIDSFINFQLSLPSFPPRQLVDPKSVIDKTVVSPLEAISKDIKEGKFKGKGMN